MISRAKPLTVIYWTRLLLGIIAALISALLSSLTPEFNLLNGVSIALLLYIVTYYVYKFMFLAKVEKPSKIFTTGVGAYFLSWVVMFAMFTTLTGPTTVTITNPNNNAIFSINDAVAIEARVSNPLGSSFSGANVTAMNPTDALIQLIETSPGLYSATYVIEASDPSGEWNIEVMALAGGRHLEASVNVIIQIAS